MENQNAAMMKVIETILIRFERARSDDRFLIAKFWENQCRMKNSGLTESFEGFLHNFAAGEYAHPDSITRLKRMLLHDFRPDLRPPDWGKKQAKAEKVKEDLSRTAEMVRLEESGQARLF